MRIFITGGTGFVGSNIIKMALETRNAHVCTTTRYWSSPKSIPFDTTYVDLCDPVGLKEAARAADPSVIIHSAIENDFQSIRANRRLGWDSFVGSTRALSEVANELGVKLVLISTDWVFDGAQPFASESTPPNPINMYGVLKLASEMVVTNHTRQGAVARIASVNGVHWLRPDFQSFQNTGMGHFAGAVIDAITATGEFGCWSGPVNMVANPTLATECAEMILRIAEGDATGTFHCTGTEAMSRLDYARKVAHGFGFGEGSVTVAPVDFSKVGPDRCPVDTSLDNTFTRRTLGFEPSDVAAAIGLLRSQREAASNDDWLAARTRTVTS